MLVLAECPFACGGSRLLGIAVSPASFLLPFFGFGRLLPFFWFCWCGVARRRPRLPIGFGSARPVRAGEGEDETAISCLTIGHRTGLAADLIRQLGLAGSIRLITGNRGTTQRWEGWANGPGPGLWIDLPIALDHFPIEPAVQIRIGLRGVIVVVPGGIFVAVEPVERSEVGRLFVLVAVYRIAVESIGDRFTSSDDFLLGTDICSCCRSNRLANRTF